MKSGWAWWWEVRVGEGSDSSHIYGSNFGDPEDMAADSKRVLGPTLLGLYLLVSAIVLTNLLIAMVCRAGRESDWENLQSRRRV
jgi:hypothetical protein